MRAPSQPFGRRASGITGTAMDRAAFDEDAETIGEALRVEPMIARSFDDLDEPMEVPRTVDAILLVAFVLCVVGALYLVGAF